MFLALLVSLWNIRNYLVGQNSIRSRFPWKNDQNVKIIEVLQ